jgi:predicted GNAT superfamily acetyltransferase
MARSRIMAGTPPPSLDAVTCRPFSSVEDYQACVELQQVIWGRDFSDVVPLSILKINQKVGGVSAGAFAADGRLLGFVWGMTGVRGGRPFHWSHMLGVHPEARDLRLGERLKWFQRELLLPLGVEAVEWTYDPLEARNAHLNLNKLGAEVVEYVEDMYAGERGSELARGIGTDRFIVRWLIASPRVEAVRAGKLAPEDPAAWTPAPVLGVESGDEAVPLPLVPRVLVEIPSDIQTVKNEQPDLAAAWRRSTRRAFLHYFGRGYRVTAYLREADRRFYGLSAT